MISGDTYFREYQIVINMGKHLVIEFIILILPTTLESRIIELLGGPDCSKLQSCHSLKWVCCMEKLKVLVRI